MSTQLLLLDLPTPEAKTPKAGVDLMTDMWGQPATCAVCGSPNTRKGAYLICHQGHEEFCENLGRPSHPLYDQFLKYRRSIGHPLD